jgi:predicted Fe-S protein YdhL (DUF1289 family)
MMMPPDATAESPCVRMCVIDPHTGYCCGCYRTLDEISFWMRYTPRERACVVERLRARRAGSATPPATD